MSYYSGYEIVIASDNESTLKLALEDLKEKDYEFSDYDIKKVGDYYIYVKRLEDRMEFDWFIELVDELPQKYGCKIEIFTESQEISYFGHYYYDGKTDESIRESNNFVLFCHDYFDDNNLNYLLSIKPFISDVSAQAAKVFSLKCELCEKWCGFYPVTLGDNEYWQYIGRGYANTKKYIDLSEYYKSLYPEEEKAVLKDESNKGKVIRSLSYGEEIIDEYDDNGILIYHKGFFDESWWNGKGQLIHKKTKRLEIFYEYDDNDRLQREYYTEGYEIIYEYSPDGLLIEEKDSEGHRIIYSYVNGKQESKICFNPNGQIVYEKDPFGENWHGYDEKGQVICEADSFDDQEGTETRYNSDGKKIMSFCSSYGTSLLSFLDNKGRTIYLSCCNNSNGRYVFDDKSCLKYKMCDFNKVINREKEIEYYDGRYVDETEHDFDDSSIYDKDGKLLYSYDETNKEHKWFEDDSTYVCRQFSEEEFEWLEYDSNDILVRKIIFSNKSEWLRDLYYHEYDNNNNLVHVIEGAGNQEWRDYDESGRLIHSKDIWGKETAFEYDNKNTLIHKSEMIGGQVWNDYDYNESEKLLYFKDIWGKERVFECDDRDILKSVDLDYQTNKDTFSGNIKILFSKDKWGEYKYEYDEKGGYTKYVLNKNGEFEVECCDNDSCDENEVIIEDLDLDW